MCYANLYVIIWIFILSLRSSRYVLINCCCKVVVRLRKNLECKNRYKKCISNAAVYGELGSYPLYMARFMRIIKYWFKVINTDNTIMKPVYNMSYVDCF